MVCFFGSYPALRTVWNEFGRKKQLPEGCFFCCAQGTGGVKDSFSAARPGFPGHSHPNMVNMKQFLLRGSLGVARCRAFFSCCPLRRWRTADSRSPAAGAGEGGRSAAFGAAGGRENSPDSVCQGCPIQRAVSPGLRRGLCLSLPPPILRRRNPACRTRSYPALQSKGRSGRPPG